MGAKTFQGLGGGDDGSTPSITPLTPPPSLVSGGEESVGNHALQPVFSVRRMSAEEQVPRPGDLDDEEGPGRRKSFRVIAVVILLAGGATVAALRSGKIPGRGAAEATASSDLPSAPAPAAATAAAAAPIVSPMAVPPARPSTRAVAHVPSAPGQVPRAAETPARPGTHREVPRTRSAPAHSRRDVRSNASSAEETAPAATADQSVAGDADSTLPPSIE